MSLKVWPTTTAAEQATKALEAMRGELNEMVERHVSAVLGHTHWTGDVDPPMTLAFDQAFVGVLTQLAENGRPDHAYARPGDTIHPEQLIGWMALREDGIEFQITYTETKDGRPTVGGAVHWEYADDVQLIDNPHTDDEEAER